ncbi:glycosyltransferase family 2 protein [Candidatus Woesearchaeota archaeon]|nr:glycosyltransferase family 2 protein [Candidatus Woesearchaeota archaeon]
MIGGVEVLVWAMYLLGLYFTIFWLYAFLERYELFREEAKSSASGKRKLSRFPKVSVIIPAYNAEATIRECVLSVANLDYPKDRLEIMVVNDGSTDNTAAIVSELICSCKGADIKLMSQENLGKGAAMNNAIKECVGEFFACLDSDSFVEPETLHRMLYVFGQHGPELAIVTPAMKVFRPTSFIQKFQRLEYIVTLFFNRLLSHFDALYVAPGPFSLYRKGIVMELGGFDEHNLTEDQEIGYRMQKHNYRLKHCFDAYVYTTAPGSVRQLYRQRSRWWRGSLLNFLMYKSMFLNPKYGHFGVFQLPMIMLGYITVWAVVFFFTYFTILPWWQRFYGLYLVGFDLPTLLRGINFSFDVLRYDFGKVFIILTLAASAITTFLLAHRSSREAVFRHGLVYLPFYFLFYYILLSFMYILAALQLVVFGRRDKWLGKST